MSIKGSSIWAKISHHFLFVAGLLLAVLLLFFALLINSTKWISAQVFSHKDQIETWVENALHQPISIGDIQESWQGVEPVLSLRKVKIYDAQKKQILLAVDELDMGVDLLHSVLHWGLYPGHLTIAGANIVLRQDAAGHFQFVGMQSSTEESGASSEAVSSTLLWLLTQTNINISKVNVDWHRPDQTIIPIHNIRFTVSSDFGVHRLAGVATLAQTIPTEFGFVINVDNLSVAKQNFDGKVYLFSNHLSLPQWLQLSAAANFFEHLQVTSGDSNVEAWADFSQSRVNRLAVLLDAHQVNLQSRVDAKKNLMLQQLGGNLLWQKIESGWRLTADHLLARVQGVSWPSLTVSVQYQNPNSVSAPVIDKAVPPSGNLSPTQTATIPTARPAPVGPVGPEGSAEKPVQMLINVSTIQLQNILAIQQSLDVFPDLVKRWIRRLKPQGELHDLRFLGAFQTQPNQTPSVSLSAHFKEMAVDQWQQLPSVSGLAGDVALTPHRGRMLVHSGSTYFDLPSLFSHSLRFQDAKADIGWQQNEQGGWTVTAPHFDLKTDVLETRGRLQLISQTPQGIKIDFSSQLQLQDLAHLKDYFPERYFAAHLKTTGTWLEKAFVQGKVVNGTLLWKGALKDFPYDQTTPLQKEAFQITLPVQGMQFHYLDHWPDLNNVTATLAFNDASLRVQASKSDILGVPLQQLEAEIPTLKHTRLKVVAASQLDAGQLINILKATPLSIGSRLSILNVNGLSHLNLQLDLPLADSKLPSQVKAHLDLHQATLAVPTAGIRLTGLTGPLELENSKLSSPQLTAFYKQLPVVLNINSIVEPQQTQLIITGGGKLSVAALQQQFPALPLQRYLSGESDFRTILNISTNPQQGIHFNVISDLIGIKVNLPAEFEKPAEVASHFELNTNIGGPLHLRMALGERLKMAMEFHSAKTGTAFYSGVVHLGAGLPDFQTSPGWFIEGGLDSANWSAWQPFIQGFSTGATSTRASAASSLRQVALAFNQFTFLNIPFPMLHLKVTPGTTAWNIGLNSPGIDGVVYYPHNPKNVLRGRFQKFSLEADFQKAATPAASNVAAASSAVSAAATVRPQDLSPMDFSATHFYYAKQDWGQFNLVTRTTVKGIEFDRLYLKSPLLELNTKGYWHQQGAQQKSFLGGYFLSTNWGQLFTSHHWTKMLAEGSGSLQFRLHWAGPIYAFNTQQLNGTTLLTIQNGRILQLGESTEAELGIGRLLSLFSLQALPKRLLTFNFNDLTKKGFSFDSLKGDFMVASGDATTHNASLNGSVAKVDIRGRIGLARKDYNLVLQVMPNVTSSLPLVATIAGGPIAGAITWLANKIIGPTVGKAIGVSYQVKGPWSQPEIIKLQAQMPPSSAPITSMQPQKGESAIFH